MNGSVACWRLQPQTALTSNPGIGYSYHRRIMIRPRVVPRDDPRGNLRRPGWHGVPLHPVVVDWTEIAVRPMTASSSSVVTMNAVPRHDRIPVPRVGRPPNQPRKFSSYIRVVVFLSFLFISCNTNKFLNTTTDCSVSVFVFFSIRIYISHCCMFLQGANNLCGTSFLRTIRKRLSGEEG